MKTKQEFAAWAIREHKWPAPAAEVLRSRAPIPRELRVAIADLIEGKVKLKPGRKRLFAAFDREGLKAHLRGKLKALVEKGRPRDDAIADLAAQSNIAEPSMRRLLGLKGRT